MKYFTLIAALLTSLPLSLSAERNKENDVLIVTTVAGVLVVAWYIKNKWNKEPAPSTPLLPKHANPLNIVPGNITENSSPTPSLDNPIQEIPLQQALAEQGQIKLLLEEKNEIKKLNLYQERPIEKSNPVQPTFFDHLKKTDFVELFRNNLPY